MKKIINIETPREIIMGDPMFFKKYKGRELTNLTIKRKTTKKDIAKVKIEEFDDVRNNEKNVELTLYIAPKDNIDTYIKDQYYRKQTIKRKPIDTESKQYMIKLDGKENIITSDEKGQLATEYIYRHKFEGKTILDAIVIDISLPKGSTIKTAEKYVNKIFKEL